MSINWNYPAPRAGLAGLLDRFIGPGATPLEMGLQLVIPLFAAVAAPVYAAYVVPEWSPLQYAVCALLAFDITGGIITNATSSAKRWYHRPGQGFGQHFAFVTLHLLHLALVSWLYLGFDLNWFLAAGAYLLVSASLVLGMPLYLRRPAAMTAYAGAVVLCLCVLRQPVGMEWFLPLFYLKLLVSHLPKEEPYRPQPAASSIF